MTFIGNKDFLIEVQKGNVPGHSIEHKFGRNGAVASMIFELISLSSGSPTFLQAATAVRVKAGGNANDTAAGTGAQSVTVVGIDDNLVELEENIATAGASASLVTSALFWRIYRIYLPDGSVGTYDGSNDGIITIENGAGGTDLIIMAANEGQSQFANYTVPTGKTAQLLSSQITVDANKPADVKLMRRNNFNDVSTPFSPTRLVVYFDGLVGHTHFDPKSPMKFDALTDIWWEAEGSGAQTEVSVDFELLLVDN